MAIRTRHLGLVCFFVFIAIPPDRAWIQARQEVGQPVEESTGSDPATAEPSEGGVAGDLLDSIWNLLNSVSDRVDTAITRATEARDRATQARDHAADMVSNMQDGFGQLTAEMQEWIQDAVASVQQAIQQELAGAQAFIDGPNSCSAQCEAFRDDLIALLTSVEDISNALLVAEGLNGSVDLASEVDWIDSLPGKALYPLYRVLQAAPILDEDFLTTMSGVATDLETIADIIDESRPARGLPDVCVLLAENEELVSNVITAAQHINKVGKGSKTVGSLLSALGKTKVSGRVGAWGFAGISYSGGLLERMGGHLETLGNKLTPIADKAQKKIQYCVLKVNDEIIIVDVGTKHQEFMETDQAILDALKAIQMSLGTGDLDSNGVVDLSDYYLFHQGFGVGN